MAVIHISEEEAAKNFLAFARKASNGEEIMIEGGQVPLRLSRADALPNNLSMPHRPRARRLSEILAAIELRGDSGVTLDDTFGDDLDSPAIASKSVPNGVPHTKTLSEAIRLADERALDVMLDDQFGRDLEQVICNHEHEVLRDPWAE